MNNRKMKMRFNPKTQNESTEIQKILFKLGYEWKGLERNKTANSGFSYLFAESNGRILCSNEEKVFFGCEEYHYMELEVASDGYIIVEKHCGKYYTINGYKITTMSKDRIVI